MLPDGVQLLVLLLRKLQALLLHLVDLLLRTQGLLGHHQVILQHVLLLPPPLYPGVLDLSGFWNRPQRLWVSTSQLSVGVVACGIHSQKTKSIMNGKPQ